ncbi:unnamed protein product [Rotaria socialis]|uniref:Uncharacterized protein n=1 Tax=Rotaria socialis TaxID=392032 RepID=A0A817WKH0_9BILA|nr:unnamed protein product [Rotaria socialis]CAF4665770.1 unnamed protein product [Rotaria socialis]
MKKLFLYNLEQPGERNNVSGVRLWHCAGATALNDALDRAAKTYQNTGKLQRNELLIAHLDDDDTWHPYHLQNLVDIYHRFPSVHFAWSKGYFCASRAGAIKYPYTQLPDTVNNMPPTSGMTLHSTVSWKMKTFLSFRYRRDWEFVNESYQPADGDMWQRMSHFMRANNISYYHTSLTTVEHLEEGGSKPCTKADNESVWYPDQLFMKNEKI